ncbi:hypothetical protein BWQ96_00788 [Gracilariopsis chorda]|uniref:DNA-directed RNA polymerase III subunit RPC9 n=1 Tax=Gracilariopsis chorda TaxID=448386 RepID=A0A2V3J5S4_9FLOR|nr:hypothetical protein BWQ96_00788 [Gracilariopsis chorda]|eukprot:PXF49472.1 hypothetical protein BWQ96_00788 [Gracilariopsis chorda]
MKILSNPDGDGLLTNAEVHEWLKEKKFETARRDVPEGVIKPPHSTASISRQVRQYIESSPAGNVSVSSLRKLYEKLEKFKLSKVEKLMIANIRPDAYAHLTPLIVDVYSRYDENQLYEMLGIINDTLEKRTKPLEQAARDANGEELPSDVHGAHETNGNKEEAVEATANGIGAVTLSNESPPGAHL